MLPSALRLKKQADFKRVLDAGLKRRFDNFLVFFRPSDLAMSRLGMVVSKKVAKQAVRRNKLRRQISQLFYPTFKQWDFPTKGDMVVMVLANPTQGWEEIVREVEKIKLWLAKLPKA